MLEIEACHQGPASIRMSPAQPPIVATGTPLKPSCPTDTAALAYCQMLTGRVPPTAGSRADLGFAAPRRPLSAPAPAGGRGGGCGCGCARASPPNPAEVDRQSMLGSTAAQPVPNVCNQQMVCSRVDLGLLPCTHFLSLAITNLSPSKSTSCTCSTCISGQIAAQSVSREQVVE